MQLEFQDRVALLRMKAGKANAMNAAFLGGMEGLLDELDASPAGALVLTGSGSTFCAGLDMVELSALDRGELGEWMERLHDLLLRLFGHPRPVVAALNGHAIAGGCVLALQADWRVLAENGARMGLTETRLGVGLPAVATEALRVQLPADVLLPVALEGGLFEPEEALHLGLVHEILPAGEVEARALERAGELADIPPPGWSHVKRAIRAPAIERVQANRAGDLELWLDTWFSEEGQQRISAAVRQLGGKG